MYFMFRHIKAIRAVFDFYLKVKKTVIQDYAQNLSSRCDCVSKIIALV